MKKTAMLLAGVANFVVSVPLFAQTGEAVGASPALQQTTELKALTIEPGMLPKASDGRQVTLTVDGVERQLNAGSYKGNVVLSVTEDIPVQYHQLPVHHFRTALYVENGAPVPAKSVSSALQGAMLSAGTVTDARITSTGERFNGIMVTGNGKYTIDRPIIDLTGNGGNDFAGFGAAIMSNGHADVTVNQPIIRTRGAIRTALFVGGDSTMHVNDAEIEVVNGTLPSDYKFTVDVGRMMEVPWMLGLSGNVRASNLVDRGTLYISNSHIRSQGWGVLSTDDNTHVRMFVDNSLIEAVEAGYGTYSIGDSVNTFSHSVIKAADIGAIMAAEGSATFTNRTLVYAGRYGVMMHSGVGGGTLTIDKGSEVHAGRTAIEVKGIGTTILVDDAKVTSGNGIILQAMENDDPFLKAMMSGKMPEGMGAPPPGMNPDGDHPGPKGLPSSPDVSGTFRHASLTGDFFNGRTAQGGMKLRFEDTQVTGRITTSTVAPASGKEPVRETYQEIGNVTNTPAPATTANGLAVSLDRKSHWTVTGTSYLARLELAPGAQIDAGASKLQLLVDGKPAKIKAGVYAGKITLLVK
ncbi:MAG: right-handed parallel beta-helix repeat-containing protein [Proteobacteria bacterium]|nr:right-handed parallel beta-helix repeat-containing protein [Pseudomonadota bacterium]